MSESLVGLSALVSLEVTEDMLAKNVGSGSVSVFSTPDLILLLEKTAVAALEGQLNSNQTTVGSGLDVTHLAATPVAMKVTGSAKVVAVDGRKVIFEVAAQDEQEKIAEGTHTRYIVDTEKFQARADSKLNTEELP